MGAYQRNLLVGVTVLGALVFMVFCIIEFGTKAASLFASPHINVEIDAPRADHLDVGSQITYQGLPVGQITSLSRNTNGIGVTMQAEIDTKPPVPINVDALIVMTSVLGGQGSIELDLQRDPDTGLQEPPQFPQAGALLPTIHAQYVGLNFLPPEYTIAITRIGAAANEIAQSAAKLRESGVYDHIDQAVQNANKQMDAMGKVVASLQNIVGDQANQQDIKTAITNLRIAMVNLNHFSNGLPQTQQQVAAVLQKLDDIAAKIDKGQGTAGMLVNDPRLYQSMVACTNDVDGVLKDFQRLLEQWEQEGLHLKL